MHDELPAVTGGGTVPMATKERALSAALLCCVVLAAVLPHPAHAGAPRPRQPTAHADKGGIEFGALDERVRLRILIGMIRSGGHEQAAQMLRDVPFRGPYAANRTLFLEGLIAEARGDLKDAVQRFRKALASDPNLTMVRIELANVLFRLNDDDGARHHLELLIGAAPTPELVRTFEGFLDAIDERRPWDFDFWVSVVPSTNFNNGTSKKTVWIDGLPFQVDHNTLERSGIGLRGGTNGSYQFRLGEDLSLVTAAGVNYTDYEGDVFDDFLLSQTVELRHKSGWTEVWLGAIAQERWSGDESLWSLGPQLTIKQRFGPRTGGYLRLRHSFNLYDRAGYRDGTTSGGEGRVSWSMSPATVLYALAGAERGTATLPHLDYWSAMGGLAAYHEFGYGLTLYSEGRLRRTLYDGDYPFMDEGRDDIRLDLRATLTKRDFEIFGLAPQLEYTYSKAWSNTPFDSFEAHGASVTLTKQF
jgi:outer membrane protein